MQARGFSLVEMVVVICIVSTLLAIGTLRFNEYMVRYRREAQIRMIYSELLKARADAVYQRRGTRVKLYADRLEIYSSAADNGASPIVERALGYQIVWNSTGNDVDFDAKGIAQNLRSICLGAGDGSSAVDSVVIGQTRVSIGKKDALDGGCKAENITIQ